MKQHIYSFCKELMNYRNSVIILLTLVFFTNNLHAQKQDTSLLYEEISKLMEIGDVPGLSVAIIDGGQSYWVGSLGTLNDSLQTPVKRNTIFPAASLSKPVFAYIVMRLVERGEFDLDKPLSEFLENKRMEHDPRYKNITARMVLSHSTGLPNWGGSQLNLRFDPGTGFDYSGEGYVYLQQVIESITDISLEELAQREEFTPLGMLNSSYIWQERFTGNAVYGKDWVWRVSHLPRYSEPNAAFSLLTTAEDYSKFVNEILNNHELGKQYIESMLSPQLSVHRPWRPTDADTHVYWGLGWGLQKMGSGWALFHWGDNGAYKSYVIVYPESKTGLVYFTNSHDGLSIAHAIVSKFWQQEHWALRWLNYGHHDNPQRLAIKKIQRAAVSGGSEEALDGFMAALNDSTIDFSDADIGNISEFLSARNLNDAALKIMEIGMQDHSGSDVLQNRYAELLLTAGKYEEAISIYQHTLDNEPDNQDAIKRIEWIEQRWAIENVKVNIPPSLMKHYAGEYGPRQVRIRDGRLYYQRQGNKEYLMLPLTKDLFALKGMETFRLQFVQNGKEPASKLIGIYIDGGRDENERSK